jgi:hypothetical protein
MPREIITWRVISLVESARCFSRNRPKVPPPRESEFRPMMLRLMAHTIPIDIGGQTYSTSEILYSTDYEAYREIGIELSQAQRDDMALR